MGTNDYLKKWGTSTKAIHAGVIPDEKTGAIVEPIYQCSVYAQKFPGEFQYDYGRSMNPNYYQLEEALAALEFGKYATVVSSGVGAITAVMTLIRAGETVIMPTDVYGGTYRVFIDVFEKWGLSYAQLDLNDLDAVETHLKDGARIIYAESPTNPLLLVYDLAALAKLSRKYNAISVVDNTFASPCHQNPLNLGIDIVIHSTSKYIGGHSDIVGGVIITNDEKVSKQMDFARKSLGVHIDPFTMFLMRRGMKTLPLRMERTQENAMAFAKHLENHQHVEKVLYPGLLSHPQHELVKKQMLGFSGIMSVFFDLEIEKMKKLISSFKVITLAESLGAVETLVEHPTSMTHQKIPKEMREKYGLTDGLVRFSMGIENINDLIEDFEQAFRSV